MKKLYLGLVLASFGILSACSGGGEPSANDISDAYKNVAQRNYDEALRKSGGSTENLPLMVKGLILHPAIFRIEYQTLEREGVCYLDAIGTEYGTRLTLQTVFQGLLSVPVDHPDRSALKYHELLLVVEELIHSDAICDRPVDERLIVFWRTKAATCDLRKTYTTVLATDLLRSLDQTSPEALRAKNVDPVSLRERLRWLKFADCAPKSRQINIPSPQPEEVSWRDLPIGKSLVRYDTLDISADDVLIDDQYMVFLNTRFSDKATLAGQLGIAANQIVNLMVNLNAAVVQIDQETARLLLQKSSLIGIMQDRYGFFTEGRTANNAGQDLVDQFHIGLDDKFTPLVETRPVRVYVVDGGTQQTHPEFTKKLSHWRAIGKNHGGFTRDVCEQHGTAVASLIAGQRFGIASSVDLVDVDITPCATANPQRFPASHILLALDWITQAEDWFDDSLPTLINMSLNVPIAQESAFEKQSNIPGLPSVVGVRAFENQVINFLERYPNITLVAAAGNEAENACLFFPARMEQVITVGGTTHKDTLWGQGNFGPCVDTYALAVDIAVASSIATTPDGVRVTGTSFSAAIATGVIANRLASGQAIEDIKADILRPYTMDRRAEIQQARIGAATDDRFDGQLKFYAKIPTRSRAECIVASYDGTLNLRAKARYNSKVLRVLNNGEGFKILKRSGDKWAFVRLEDGQKGWVARYDKTSILVEVVDSASPC